MKLKPGERDEKGRLFVCYMHYFTGPTGNSFMTGHHSAQFHVPGFESWAHKVKRLYRRENRYRKALRELVECELSGGRACSCGIPSCDLCCALERARQLLEET